MLSEFLFFLGFFIGAIINTIWYDLHLDKKDMRVQSWEHYHHAIMLAYISKWIPQPYDMIPIGIALALIVDEAYRQKYPFAIGSNHFKKSLLITIFIITILIVVEACL